MAFHPVAACLASIVIAPLAVTMPVFGFAAFTAAIAAYAYLAHNSAKLRAERAFFAEAAPSGFSSVRIGGAAIGNALVRALAVGMLALFTFPPLDAADMARGGPLAAHGAQMHAERLPTIVIIYMTLVIGTLVTALFARTFRARGERWALYRLGLLFGLIFSALVTAANANSDAIESVLPESQRLRAEITLYDPPQTLAVLEAVRGLHTDLTQAEQKRAGLDKRSRECARDFWIDAYDLRERINRAAWRCEEHTNAVDPLPIAQTAILTMAVFDDLIDGLISDLVASVLGTLSPDGGPATTTAQILSQVVLSSNLLQGFVLAIYIAPLAGALQTGGRRRRPRSETLVDT